MNLLELKKKSDEAFEALIKSTEPGSDKHKKIVVVKMYADASILIAEAIRVGQIGAVIDIVENLKLNVGVVMDRS